MEEEVIHRVKLFYCHRCDFSCRYFDKILNHYSIKHSHVPGFGLVCGIDGCHSRYTVISSYKTHLRRKHPVFHQEHIAIRQRQAAPLPFQERDDINDLPDPLFDNDNLGNVDNVNQEAIQPES